MSYSFKEVVIKAFEIHPTVDPLVDQSSDYFQTGFDFLIDEQKYNDFYQSGGRKRTINFEISPLALWEQKTHFWKGYRENMPVDKTNAWQLQLPFKCHPFKTPIKPAVVDENNFNIKIRPAVYLSALGWSTIVSIHLRGDIRKSQLTALMSQLMDKIPGQKPFLIDGRQPANLRDIFNYFKELLLGEIYVASKPPHQGDKLTRHVIVSLNKFVGSPIIYKEMADSDRMMLRSILFGRKLEAGDEEKEKTSYPLLLTEISPPFNFALTNFNYGSLIFLQSDALKDERQAAINCHSNNIANCLMMIFAFLKFNELAKGEPKNNSLENLLGQIKINLCSLPKRYPNQLCENIFRKNKFITCKAD